jgi:hypothetical protein
MAGKDVCGSQFGSAFVGAGVLLDTPDQVVFVFGADRDCAMLAGQGVTHLSPRARMERLRIASVDEDESGEERGDCVEREDAEA